MKHLQELLPEFPRIKHLPHKPNTVRGDLVASADEIAAIFSGEGVGSRRR